MNALLRNCSLVLTLGIFPSCITYDWDGAADLSLTDRDHFDQYTPYYLDYEKGRVNLVLEPSLVDGEQVEGRFDYYVFINDILHVKETGVAINDREYLVWPSSNVIEKLGAVIVDPLPVWIEDQMSESDKALYAKALEGDPSAMAEMGRYFKENPKTPFGQGIRAMAKYWEGRLDSENILYP